MADHANSGIDSGILGALKRRDRRVILAENPMMIHRFMAMMKEGNPGVMEHRRAWAIASRLFDHEEIDVERAAESGATVADMGRIRVLVAAIFRYMEKAGKIKLWRGHYYWREYDYERFARRRNRTPRETPEEYPEEPDDTEDDSAPMLRIKVPR